MNDSLRDQGTPPKKVPLSLGENATCWMLAGDTSQLIQTGPGDSQKDPGENCLRQNFD